MIGINESGDISALCNKLREIRLMFQTAGRNSCAVMFHCVYNRWDSIFKGECLFMYVGKYLYHFHM